MLGQANDDVVSTPKLELDQETDEVEIQNDSNAQTMTQLVRFKYKSNIFIENC